MLCFFRRVEAVCIGLEGQTGEQVGIGIFELFGYNVGGINLLYDVVCKGRMYRLSSRLEQRISRPPSGRIMPLI